MYSKACGFSILLFVAKIRTNYSGIAVTHTLSMPVHPLRRNCAYKKYGKMMG